ncbi:hypothetical protein ACA910_017017 [Epithemia clementina (nom. ined.)]
MKTDVQSLWSSPSLCNVYEPSDFADAEDQNDLTTATTPSLAPLHLHSSSASSIMVLSKSSSLRLFQSEQQQQHQEETPEMAATKSSVTRMSRRQSYPAPKEQQLTATTTATPTSNESSAAAGAAAEEAIAATTKPRPWLSGKASRRQSYPVPKSVTSQQQPPEDDSHSSSNNNNTQDASSAAATKSRSNSPWRPRWLPKRHKSTRSLATTASSSTSSSSNENNVNNNNNNSETAKTSPKAPRRPSLLAATRKSLSKRNILGGSGGSPDESTSSPPTLTRNLSKRYLGLEGDEEKNNCNKKNQEDTTNEKGNQYKPQRQNSFRLLKQQFSSGRRNSVGDNDASSDKEMAANENTNSSETTTTTSRKPQRQGSFRRLKEHLMISGGGGGRKLKGNNNGNSTTTTSTLSSTSTSNNSPHKKPGSLAAALERRRGHRRKLLGLTKTTTTTATEDGSRTVDTGHDADEEEEEDDDDNDDDEAEERTMASSGAWSMKSAPAALTNTNAHAGTTNSLRSLLDDPSGTPKKTKSSSSSLNLCRKLYYQNKVPPLTPTTEDSSVSTSSQRQRQQQLLSSLGEEDGLETNGGGEERLEFVWKEIDEADVVAPSPLAAEDESEEPISKKTKSNNTKKKKKKKKVKPQEEQEQEQQPQGDESTCFLDPEDEDDDDKGIFGLQPLPLPSEAELCDSPITTTTTKAKKSSSAAPAQKKKTSSRRTSHKRHHGSKLTGNTYDSGGERNSSRRSKRRSKQSSAEVGDPPADAASYYGPGATTTTSLSCGTPNSAEQQLLQHEPQFFSVVPKEEDHNSSDENDDDEVARAVDATATSNHSFPIQDFTDDDDDDNDSMYSYDDSEDGDDESFAAAPVVDKKRRKSSRKKKKKQILPDTRTPKDEHAGNVSHQERNPLKLLVRQKSIEKLASLSSMVDLAKNASLGEEVEEVQTHNSNSKSSKRARRHNSVDNSGLVMAPSQPSPPPATPTKSKMMMMKRRSSYTGGYPQSSEEIFSPSQQRQHNRKQRRNSASGWEKHLSSPKSQRKSSRSSASRSGTTSCESGQKAETEKNHWQDSGDDSVSSRILRQNSLTQSNLTPSTTIRPNNLGSSSEQDGPSATPSPPLASKQRNSIGDVPFRERYHKSPRTPSSKRKTIKIAEVSPQQQPPSSNASSNDAAEQTPETRQSQFSKWQQHNHSGNETTAQTYGRPHERMKRRNSTGDVPTARTNSSRTQGRSADAGRQSPKTPTKTNRCLSPNREITPVGKSNWKMVGRVSSSMSPVRRRKEDTDETPPQKRKGSKRDSQNRRNSVGEQAPWQSNPIPPASPIGRLTLGDDPCQVESRNAGDGRRAQKKEDTTSGTVEEPAKRLLPPSANISLVQMDQVNAQMTSPEHAVPPGDSFDIDPISADGSDDDTILDSGHLPESNLSGLPNIKDSGGNGDEGSSSDEDEQDAIVREYVERMQQQRENRRNALKHLKRNDHVPQDANGQGKRSGLHHGNKSIGELRTEVTGGEGSERLIDLQDSMELEQLLSPKPNRVARMLETMKQELPTTPVKNKYRRPQSFDSPVVANGVTPRIANITAMTPTRKTLEFLQDSFTDWHIALSQDSVAGSSLSASTVASVSASTVASDAEACKKQIRRKLLMAHKSIDSLQVSQGSSMLSFNQSLTSINECIELSSEQMELLEIGSKVPFKKGRVVSDRNHTSSDDTTEANSSSNRFGVDDSAPRLPQRTGQDPPGLVEASIKNDPPKPSRRSPPRKLLSSSSHSASSSHLMCNEMPEVSPESQNLFLQLDFQALGSVQYANNITVNIDADEQSDGETKDAEVDEEEASDDSSEHVGAGSRPEQISGDGSENQSNLSLLFRTNLKIGNDEGADCDDKSSASIMDRLWQRGSSKNPMMTEHSC